VFVLTEAERLHAIAICDRIQDLCAKMQKDCDAAQRAIEDFIAAHGPTKQCPRCKVDVQVSKLSEPARCLDFLCPMKSEVTEL
jgi:hypothetical protein